MNDLRILEDMSELRNLDLRIDDWFIYKGEKYQLFYDDRFYSEPTHTRMYLIFEEQRIFLSDVKIHLYDKAKAKGLLNREEHYPHMLLVPSRSRREHFKR